jgi:hypothetical protein
MHSVIFLRSQQIVEPSDSALDTIFCADLCQPLLVRVADRHVLDTGVMEIDRSKLCPEA